ncbi:unnamed protein product [Cuscuta epithymum]|uniref:Uncharacterized protein n=1 Tax=Cuscuta epithymum TaxID=186058 RepID=A0AAV0D4L2_9ASTE|nr:unnamed protein product [Cuscuta epithymum]
MTAYAAERAYDMELHLHRCRWDVRRDMVGWGHGWMCATSRRSFFWDFDRIFVGGVAGAVSGKLTVCLPLGRFSLSYSHTGRDSNLLLLSAVQTWIRSWAGATGLTRKLGLP